MKIEKTIVENAVEANRALDDHNAKIEKLEHKARALHLQMPELKRAVILAQDKKKKMIERFLLDETDESRIDSEVAEENVAIDHVHTPEPFVVCLCKEAECAIGIV